MMPPIVMLWMVCVTVSDKGYQYKFIVLSKCTTDCCAAVF